MEFENSRVKLDKALLLKSVDGNSKVGRQTPRQLRWNSKENSPKNFPFQLCLSLRHLLVVNRAQKELKKLFPSRASCMETVESRKETFLSRALRSFVYQFAIASPEKRRRRRRRREGKSMVTARFIELEQNEISSRSIINIFMRISLQHIRAGGGARPPNRFEFLIRLPVLARGIRLTFINSSWNVIN